MRTMLRSSDTVSAESDDISEEMQVQQGDTLQLHCPVSGNPLPTVNWIKMQYDVDGDQQYHEQRLNNTSAETSTLVRNSVRLK